MVPVLRQTAGWVIIASRESVLMLQSAVWAGDAGKHRPISAVRFASCRAEWQFLGVWSCAGTGKHLPESRTNERVSDELSVEVVGDIAFSSVQIDGSKKN